MLDLVVRGGHVVTPGGVVRADVGVGDGVVAEVAPDLDGARVIDAVGLHVFPGGLDPHVHFNEPGRTHWEGIKTGSAALAAGGFSAYFDMPLNSTPPVTDGAAFDAKLEAARARLVRGLRAVGRARAGRARWRSWPSGAWSASRPSCRTRGSRTSRAPTT